jgi:hypothetical protein
MAKLISRNRYAPKHAGNFKSVYNEENVNASKNVEK